MFTIILKKLRICDTLRGGLQIFHMDSVKKNYEDQLSTSANIKIARSIK